MNEKIITPQFTVEEENLICVYDITSRATLIENISAAIPDFDESEMAELAEITVNKLKAMTDAEFAEITFHPAYHGDDDSDGEIILDGTEV